MKTIKPSSTKNKTKLTNDLQDSNQVDPSTLEKVKTPTPININSDVLLSCGAFAQTNLPWCNLATFASCVFYHQGEWQNGPALGKKWDQTNPWYLAGISHQAHDSGLFWEDTLENAGIIAHSDRTSGYFLPDNFNNPTIEYRRWRITSCNQVDWTFWPDFELYIKNSLHGAVDGKPAPVMLGQAHTRLIIGLLECGSKVVLHDPLSHGSRIVLTWQQLKDELSNWIRGKSDDVLISEGQGYGTLKFLTPPPSIANRRGCLVFWEADPNTGPGSLVFCRNTGSTVSKAGQPFSYWQWDGTGGHDLGYYFDYQIVNDSHHPNIQPPFPVLPDDSRFGHRWISAELDF